MPTNKAVSSIDGSDHTKQDAWNLIALISIGFGSLPVVIEAYNVYLEGKRAMLRSS